MADKLLKGIGLQDSQHFWEPARHYNRPPGADQVTWDQMYGEYLKLEESNLEKHINTEPATQESCDKAMESLALLAHSWQDFYAHAFPKDAFTRRPPLVGDPDNRKDFHPSDFEIASFWTEHWGYGWEPIGGREQKERHWKDVQFVQHKFELALPEWLQKCGKCFCGRPEL